MTWMSGLGLLQCALVVLNLQAHGLDTAAWRVRLSQAMTKAEQMATHAEPEQSKADGERAGDPSAP